MREGLARVLSAARKIALTGVVRHAEDLRPSLAATAPDVVLLGGGVVATLASRGADVYEEVRIHRPGAGIVILAADAEQALGLVNHGAAGLACLFEHRLGSAERLVHVIAEVAAGGSVLEPEIVDLLTERRRRRARLQALSPRERQVLDLMARAYDNDAIARTLVLTERAVEKHINSIFRKLDLHAGSGRQPRVAAVLAFQAVDARCDVPPRAVTGGRSPLAARERALSSPKRRQGAHR